MSNINSFFPGGFSPGVTPDFFDPRDHYYTPNPKTVPADYVDVRKNHTLTIYNQGSTNSCVANAATAAFWFQEKVRGDASWGDDGPSRAFVYWIGRGGFDPLKDYDFTPLVDKGTHVRMAMYALSKCGTCPEADYPFPDVQNMSEEEQRWALNTKPNMECFKKAKKNAIDSYYRLDTNRPFTRDDQLTLEQKDALGADLLQKLRSCLTEGFPVCFALFFYENSNVSWDETVVPYLLKDPWTEDSNLARHTYGHQKGGHAVLAIGYDDKNQRVLVQNSWGPGSGDGTFWMPYSWVTDLYATADYWTIRLDASTAPDGPIVTWENIYKEALDSWELFE